MKVKKSGSWEEMSCPSAFFPAGLAYLLSGAYCCSCWTLTSSAVILPPFSTSLGIMEGTPLASLSLTHVHYVSHSIFIM